MEHRKIAVGGSKSGSDSEARLELHVVLAGPEDGKPVVFLHGFPEFWFGWRKQIEAFAQAGYRVIVPDQRGYNLSDKPRRISDYRIGRLARDVVDLLDALGHPKAFVVGHDWGAAVAWWLAAGFPERVEKLGILNVPHPDVMYRTVLSNFAQLKKSWYVFFFQLPGIPERWLGASSAAVAAKTLRGTSRRGTFSDADLGEYRKAWLQPGALRSMIHWYRASVRYPSSMPARGKIRVPTLIVWGKRDVFLGSEMVEPSLKKCEQGRAVFLEQATHWVQHEEPERVNRELMEFFQAR